MKTKTALVGTNRAVHLNTITQINLYFTAIIHPGEAAILAVSSTRKQPVVKDDKVVVRQMMKITLSCDHRIVDGALGARFVNAVKRKLENTELWKLLAV